MQKWQSYIYSCHSDNIDPAIYLLIRYLSKINHVGGQYRRNRGSASSGIGGQDAAEFAHFV